MNTYPVVIKQTLLRYVDVAADTPDEALDLIKLAYIVNGCELPSVDEEQPLEFGILSTNTSEQNAWLFASLDDLIDSAE